MPFRKILMALVVILLGTALLAGYIPLAETYSRNFSFWATFLAVGGVGFWLLFKEDKVLEEVTPREPQGGPLVQLIIGEDYELHWFHAFRGIYNQGMGFETRTIDRVINEEWMRLEYDIGEVRLYRTERNQYALGGGVETWTLEQKNPTGDIYRHDMGAFNPGQTYIVTPDGIRLGDMQEIKPVIVPTRVPQEVFVTYGPSDVFTLQGGRSIALGEWYELPWGASFKVFEPPKQHAWDVNYHFQVVGDFPDDYYTGQFEIPDEPGAVFALSPEGIQKVKRVTVNPENSMELMDGTPVVDYTWQPFSSDELDEDEFRVYRCGAHLGFDPKDYEACIQVVADTEVFEFITLYPQTGIDLIISPKGTVHLLGPDWIEQLEPVEVIQEMDFDIDDEGRLHWPDGRVVEEDVPHTLPWGHIITVTGRPPQPFYQEDMQYVFTVMMDDRSGDDPQQTSPVRKYMDSWPPVHFFVDDENWEFHGPHPYAGSDDD